MIVLNTLPPRNPVLPYSLLIAEIQVLPFPRTPSLFSRYLHQRGCSPQTLTPLLHSGVYVVSGSPQTRQSVFGLGGAARESLEEHAAGRLLNLKGKRQRGEEERIVQPRRGMTAAGAVRRDAEMHCTGSVILLFSFPFFSTKPHQSAFVFQNKT